MKPTQNLPVARKPRTPIIIPDAAALRALSRWTLEAPTGCHISDYSCGSHGYAQIGWSARREGGHKTRGTLAHRAAWTAVYGQIPEGQTIDHLCKNRRCVNIEHLRLLPNFENARRTSGRDWPLGYCRNGHRNDDHLHQQKGGKWVCKPCLQDSRDRYVAKHGGQRKRVDA